MSAAGDRLVRMVADDVRRGAMAGAAWWVGDATGPIASGCFGHAAIEPTTLALGADTPFDLASLTKPLATAPLALMLARDGALSLEATLGSIFPELDSLPVGSATLRDAAAHHAGFPAWAPLYLTGGTQDAYVKAIAAQARHAQPGGTLYSDLGYLLLGFAIERAAGRPLDRLFDQRASRVPWVLRAAASPRTRARSRTRRRPSAGAPSSRRWPTAPAAIAS